MRKEEIKRKIEDREREKKGDENLYRRVKKRKKKRQN